MPVSGITTAIGQRFISVDDVYTAGGWDKFGFTPVGFRKFIRRALKCRTILTPSGHLLVNYASFLLALQCASRIKDGKTFVCPGAKKITHNKVDLRTEMTELPTEELTSDWLLFVSEILYAQRLDWAQVSRETKVALTEAGRRMAAALEQMYAENLTTEQRRLIKKARRTLAEPALA